METTFSQEAVHAAVLISGGVAVVILTGLSIVLMVIRLRETFEHRVRKARAKRESALEHRHRAANGLSTEEIDLVDVRGRLRHDDGWAYFLVAAFGAGSFGIWAFFIGAHFDGGIAGLSKMACAAVALIALAFPVARVVWDAYWLGLTRGRKTRMLRRPTPARSYEHSA